MFEKNIKLGLTHYIKTNDGHLDNDKGRVHP
jgi:hypothetical protein